MKGRVEKKNRKGTVYYVNDLGEFLSKLCSKCIKDIPADGFRRKKGGLGGKASICKLCESSIGRKYREENLNKIREINKQYYINNRDAIRAKQRLYHSENPHIAHERARRWRKNFPEKAHVQSIKWRRENQERVRNSTHRRLARKRNLPNSLSIEEVDTTLNAFKGCALTNSTEFHFDHVIPLATGHGGTIFGNIIPLRRDLNVSKSDRNMFDWFDANRQRFNLSQEKFNFLIKWLAEVNGVSVTDYQAHVYWCHENPHCLEDLLDDEGEAI